MPEPPAPPSVLDDLRGTYVDPDLDPFQKAERDRAIAESVPERGFLRSISEPFTRPSLLGIPEGEGNFVADAIDNPRTRGEGPLAALKSFGAGSLGGLVDYGRANTTPAGAAMNIPAVRESSAAMKALNVAGRAGGVVTALGGAADVLDEELDPASRAMGGAMALAGTAQALSGAPAGPRPAAKPGVIPPLPRGFRALNEELGDLNALRPPTPETSAPPVARAEPFAPPVDAAPVPPTAAPAEPSAPPRARLSQQDIEGLRQAYRFKKGDPADEARLKQVVEAVERSMNPTAPPSIQPQSTRRYSDEGAAPSPARPDVKPHMVAEYAGLQGVEAAAKSFGVSTDDVLRMMREDGRYPVPEAPVAPPQTLDELLADGRIAVPKPREPQLPIGAVEPEVPPVAAAADDPLFAGVLEDARAQGYDGSDDLLRDLYGDAGQSARSLVADTEQAIEEDDLVALIRRLGGLRPTFSDGLGGRYKPDEITSLQELVRKAGLYGRNDIVRRGIDDMTTAERYSRQVEGRAGGGLDHDDLFTEVSRQRPDLGLRDSYEMMEELKNRLQRRIDGNGPRVPSLEEALGATGVRKGEPWWDDAVHARAGRKVLDEGANEPVEAPDRAMGRGDDDPLESFLDESVEPWDDARDIRFRPLLREAAERGVADKPMTLWNRYLDQVDAGNSNPTLDDLLGGRPSRAKKAAPPAAADVLPTGEVQPRLPGDAGAIRDVEVATPREELPFALTREVAPAPKTEQTALDDLFSDRAAAGEQGAAAAPSVASASRVGQVAESAPTSKPAKISPDQPKSELQGDAKPDSAAKPSVLDRSTPKTQAEVQKRIAELNARPMTAEDVDELGRLYTREAELANDALFTGGTGKELKGGSSTLGSGLGSLEVLLKPENRPALVKVLQYTGASLSGAAMDDENRVRGALIGALAAAGTKTGLKAIKQWRANRGAAKKSAGPKDIHPLRLAGLPEQTVPDIFYDAHRGLTQLQGLYDSTMLSDKVRGQAMAIQKADVVKGIRTAAAEAKKLGLKRKAYYAERLADSVEGKLTKGQRAVQKAGEVAGLKLKGNEIERYGTANVYRVLTGYALDTAAKNLTQPILALAQVSPKSLLAAYKVARTPAAKEFAEKQRIHTSQNVDVAEDLRGMVTTADDKKPVGKWHPQNAIITSDNFNRRVAYFAALAERGELESALTTGKVSDSAREFAEQLTRKTQGSIGSTPEALESNPIMRGPVAGSLKPFTKFPTLFIENMVDALNGAAKGDGRKQKFLVGLLGAALAGNAIGIDLEDLLLGGGRPLGLGPFDLMDYTKVAEKLNPVGDRSAFPVGRAIGDAFEHVTGDADHDLLGIDPRTSDLPTLAAGRYPVKFVTKVGQALDGEEDPLTALANLLGLKTTEQTSTAERNDEMYRYLRKRQQESRRESAKKRRTGPKPSADAFDRVRKQLSGKDREEFDELFGGGR